MFEKMVKYLGLILFCVVITFLYNLLFLNINCDEIWNYGFSYNLTKGLIIYRDYNVLQTPLYFFIGSFFVKIFGNYIYSLDLYTSFIVAIIILISYIKIGKKSLILLPILIPNILPNYNSLCFLFVVIIMILNDSCYKKKFYLIGFFVGLIFLTKQSIGISIFILMILFNKERIKCLIGFLIPCLLLSIYLIYNSAFYEFVNYCFLGMIDFGHSNFECSLIYFVIFIIFYIFVLYNCFKSKFKDINSLYVAVFQVIAYPIFDRNHIIIGIVLYFLYLLYYKINIKDCYFKYFFIISFSYLISFCLLPRYNYHLYSDRNSFLNNKGLFNHLSAFDDKLSWLKKEIVKRNDYDNIYVFSIFHSETSYAVKLDLGYRINKYDLILNGNMGYNGSTKYIYELDYICKRESCVYFIDNVEYDVHSQTNKDIINYVKDNYYKIDSISNSEVDYSIYSNRKE